jgi:beta-lactamase superfamily II metal-dependent hydrolase
MMPVLHFLNVRSGDCSIIQHGSGRVTMVDVNNARRLTESERIVEASIQKYAATSGNFNQKAHPVNPIEYMRERGIGGPFRFVLTHPDMDHMDGIVDIFAEFSPPNIWDTENTCDKDADDWDNAPYRKEDWDFYCRLRTTRSNPKRLTYLSGQSRCDFWKDDGIDVLSPTQPLLDAANEASDWNDASYVLRYSAKHSNGEASWKVVLAGDSHDATWEHIIDVHADVVSDIDLLLAPHHGRDSDRDHVFLDVLKPKLTLFGNAPSEHLAYDEWSRRELPVITNNQAGSVVVDFSSKHGAVYCTNKKYAEKELGSSAHYNDVHKAWLCAFVR